MGPAEPARTGASSDAPASGGDRPVAGRERLVHVDALRGAALFGILLVNLLAFSGPSFLHTRPLSWWSGADRWVEWGILVTAEGAFFTLFSLLFGWGFGRWMRTRGSGARRRFGRRIGWLLAIGLVHLFGLWVGDILVSYALVGFLLIPFAGSRARTLAVAGLVAWAVGALLFAALPAEFPITGGERWIALYGTGSAEAIVRTRLRQGLASLPATLLYAPLLGGLFLLGAAAARGRLLERLREPAVRRAGGVLAVAGLALGSGLKAIYGAQLLGDGDLDRFLLATALGGPLQGVGLAAGLSLAFTAPGRGAAIDRVVRSLAAVGRVALSAYLLQSVVMTGLFYAYGLGFYGRVGPARGVGIVIAVFALEIVLARAWLARHRFGPVEALWRRLTYGRL